MMQQFEEARKTISTIQATLLEQHGVFEKQRRKLYRRMNWLPIEDQETAAFQVDALLLENKRFSGETTPLPSFRITEYHQQPAYSLEAILDLIVKGIEYFQIKTGKEYPHEIWLSVLNKSLYTCSFSKETFAAIPLYAGHEIKSRHDILPQMDDGTLICLSYD